VSEQNITVKHRYQRGGALQTYELKLELRLPVRLIRKEMSLIALEVTGEEVKFSLWEILRTTAMRGGVASDTQGLPSGVILFVGGDFGRLFGGLRCTIASATLVQGSGRTHETPMQAEPGGPRSGIQGLTTESECVCCH